MADLAPIRPGTIRAQFERLPEPFLLTYRAELTRWARNLAEHGELLKIDLIKPAGQSVLHVDGVEPQVTLHCTVWKKGGDAVLLIEPASEFDAELIERHCRELPAIQAAAVAAPAPKARKQVDAEFKDIDELFVQHYAAELTSWGNDFGRRGPNCTIVLRNIVRQPVALDEHGQRPMIGVHLCAKVDRARAGDDMVRLIISPETEDDRRKIARHVEAIRKFGPPEAPVGRPKSRASIAVPGIH